MACIWYSEHLGSYEKSKHVRRNFHFVQQYMSDGTFKLEHCTSAENLADFFMKPRSVEQLKLVRAIIMHLSDSRPSDV